MPVDADMFRQYFRMAQPSNLPPSLQGPTGLEFKTSGGGRATELTTTIEIDGRYFNVPLLVPGQVGIKQLLKGKKASREQVGIAAKWALSNQSVPSYKSLRDALEAEYARHGALEIYD